MTRTYRTLALVALFGLLITPVAWANGYAQGSSHTFKVSTPVKVHGVELAPGKYTLQLNGDTEAIIYQKDKELVRARVEVKSLANGTRANSILRSTDGELLEVRLGKQVVVF